MTQACKIQQLLKLRSHLSRLCGSVGAFAIAFSTAPHHLVRVRRRVARRGGMGRDGSSWGGGCGGKAIGEERSSDEGKKEAAARWMLAAAQQTGDDEAVAFAEGLVHRIGGLPQDGGKSQRGRAMPAPAMRLPVDSVLTDQSKEILLDADGETTSF